jgi:hypothetical protein
MKSESKPANKDLTPKKDTSQMDALKDVHSGAHEKAHPTKNETSNERNSKSGGTRGAGIVLVLAALALALIAVMIGFNQRYWLLPPHEKLISSWRADMQLIKETKQAALFKRVAKVRLRANDHSPAADWVDKIQAPIEKVKDGDVLADVFIIHQIEGNRYGVIVQYEFIDMKNNNKIGEFARTLWLGIYY